MSFGGCGAKSGAVGTDQTANPADLEALAAQLGNLSPADRARLVALLLEGPGNKTQQPW